MFLSLFHLSANATHIAGADLTYKCLGGNDYMITFTFYRDCGGVEAPLSVTVNLTSSCGEPLFLTLYPIDSTGREVTPTCPQQLTTCQGGHLYGLQQYIYQGQIIIPPCKDWLITYYLCCRNYSNTIINSQSAGMYIPATLDNLDAPSCSSPSFTNIPVTILCEGERLCFNHGAVDPDGDSLTYALVAPFDKGPGGFPPHLIYANGFSAQQPFPSDPPISLNTVTGDICMTPTVNIIAPLAVLVTKYRNGIKIGSVLRDMQVNVIYCDNHLPVISGIDSTHSQYDSLINKYTDTICLGKTVDFSIYAHDKDTNKISITWNKAINGAKFIVSNNNSPNASARFMWKPENIDLRNTAHCFTATVADNSCPYEGTQTLSYCISVKGFAVSIGRDTVLCRGEDYSITALTDKNVVNFKWTLDGNLIAMPDSSRHLILKTNSLSTGVHNVEVAVSDNSLKNYCPGYAFARITVADNPVVSLPKIVDICQGQNLVLDAGTHAKRFLWSTGDTSRTIIVNSEGIYYVMADGGYGTNCIVFDTVSVKVIPMPSPVSLGKDSCYLMKYPLLTLDAGSNPQNCKYFWSDGENTQKINITHSGKYLVTVSSSPGSKCYKSDSIIVNFYKPHFLGTDTSICTSTAITLNAPSEFSSYAHYKWLPYGIASNQITLSDLQLGYNIIYLEVYGGCIDTLIINIKACDVIIPDVFAPGSVNGNGRFVIKNIENFPNSHIAIFNRWGELVFENSNYDNPNNRWDGGKVPAGVYYYILNISGKSIKKGSVTIIR